MMTNTMLARAKYCLGKIVSGGVGAAILALLTLPADRTALGAEENKPNASPRVAPLRNAMTPVSKPFPLDTTTLEGKKLKGQITAAGSASFRLRGQDGEETVNWRQLRPGDIYDIHLKLLEGAPADAWQALGNLLRGVEGGREMALASFVKGAGLAPASQRAAQEAALSRMKQVFENLKKLEGLAGRPAKMLPLNTLNERIWYDAPRLYEKTAANPRKLASLLADHLATADALLASEDPKLRRLGLGIATMVADGTTRHLERAKLAADIADALMLPNLDVADDESHELRRQTVIGTALYAFREANQIRDYDEACRLLHKHAYNANAKNAAKYLLGQSLARQQDHVGALMTLREVSGSGVNPREINTLVSEYRRALIGDKFQVNVLSSVPQVGSCVSTPMPTFPIQKLKYAHTREDIWYMAARVQAEVTGPVHFQIGLTNGWCTFEGDWTPDSDGEELWMFSDDGCDVYIDSSSTAALSRRKQGQKLTSWRPNDWSPSLFQVVPTSPFVGGTTYHIRIYYADLYYMNYPYYTDIDGCTLFAIAGASSLTLTASPVRMSVNQPITLTAKAKHKDSKPAVGKVIDFTVDGVVIGSAVTLADGTATKIYRPTSTGTKILSASVSDRLNASSAATSEVPFSTGSEKIVVSP